MRIVLIPVINLQKVTYMLMRNMMCLRKVGACLSDRISHERYSALEETAYLQS